MPCGFLLISNEIYWGIQLILITCDLYCSSVVLKKIYWQNLQQTIAIFGPNLYTKKGQHCMSHTQNEKQLFLQK